MNFESLQVVFKSKSQDEMILFITDQSKLVDKLASLAVKDIVTDSKLL